MAVVRVSWAAEVAAEMRLARKLPACAAWIQTMQSPSPVVKLHRQTAAVQMARGSERV